MHTIPPSLLMCVYLPTVPKALRPCFPHGWLHDQDAGAGLAEATARQRAAALRSLRQICVPHAVLLLLEVVRETRQPDMGLAQTPALRL